MSRILHLRKRLISPVPATVVSGVTIRTFNGAPDDDAHAWLGLRETAFAGLIAAGRPWTLDDFRREFTIKPWWRPERMLMAVARAGERDTVVGSATLGCTGRVPNDVACVQWLMVSPEMRRRGIGRMLLSAIERLALSLGETELGLETHATWSDAVRLYQAMGYQ